ncbi:MBL fold metallo-hydrolase [Pseudalkalibacillus sp. A8]|uniref:MBL fold metallo-hydrolase n=1 Tax=Pseudalkalibacillus sp. A8 TaxID=3382641 RepID=UPI0038B55A6F
MKKNNPVVALSTLFLLIILAGCNIDSALSTENDGNKKKKEQQENKMDSNENNPTMKVTLLGTGTPDPQINRFGGSTLVEVAGKKLLFDAGRGSGIRLNQIGIPPGEINKLFITHLHHDHTVGFPDLLISGSVPSMGGRQDPFEVWGPKGTKNMVEGLYKAYKTDIENRQNVTNATESGLDTNVHEFEEGVVYDKNGVEIIAFEVDHGSMEPAYGFRVNYKGRSVVISGDTTYSENLVKYAKGTDLLIHEVLAASSKPNKKIENESIRNIKSYHSTPEQAAKVFKQVNPKLAVYTHVISIGVSDSEGNYIERTKEIYDGKVVLGEDLMTFEIAEGITVSQP